MPAKPIITLDFPGNRTFTVVNHDILKEKVDGIVSSATNDLAYDLGIAATIADAAGHRLKTEIGSITRERGLIPSGEIVLTTAGDLPYKGVIHAVSPKAGELSGYILLKKALMSAFEVAGKKGWKSVSFPAVGSGVHALAVDRCAAAYVAAAYDYYKENPSTTLTTIRLCLINYQLADAVVKFVEHARIKMMEWDVAKPIAVASSTPGQGYQVFLSFKNLDKDGNPTRDSLLAQELYEYFTGRGLTVFFSERTLEALGVASYKGAIDNALDAAQVLVAVGTSAENLNSKWVEYERETFYIDILNETKPNGRIFSYVDGVQANKLPRTLKQMQCIQHGPDAFERLYRFVANALGHEAGAGQEPQ